MNTIFTELLKKRAGKEGCIPTKIHWLSENHQERKRYHEFADSDEALQRDMEIDSEEREKENYTPWHINIQDN